MSGPQGIRATLHKYACLLQDCTKAKDLKGGMQVHAHIKEIGLDSNLYLGNTLVYMYAKCGSLSHARHVFDDMPEYNLFSWTAIISAYADHGPAEEAVHLYQQMQQSGLTLDKYVFLAALKACVCLRCLVSGKHVHADVIKNGFEFDVFVANTLIDMYAKCYSMDDARQLFCQPFKRDIISWNVMMTGCLYQGLDEEGLTYYKQMQQEGMRPNDVTYILALKACTGCASLTNGKQIHVQVCESCSEPDISLLNTLVDMHAKCGNIDGACSVFNMMSVRDVTTWNVMIAAYAEEQQYILEAFALFDSMKEKGFKPNEITFSTILKACTYLTTLEHGQHIHVQLIKSGLKLDAFASSVLVDMYVKCGSYNDAWKMFDQMPERNNIAWNVIIAGYAQCGLTEKVFALFEQLLLEGNLPDKATVVSILRACPSLAVSDRGRVIHVYVMEMGLLSDASASNALVDMYVKCGSIEDASQAFAKMHVRDVVSWNTLIIAYAQQGLGEKAVSFLEQMIQEHVEPNHITLSSVLKVCASMAALELGMEIHKYINTNGYESFISVGSALVDMYAKCGIIADALQVFNIMQDRQVVTWTALIAGCSLQGLCREALDLFQKMQDEGVNPDTVTFVAVLSACSRAGLLQEGCYHFISMNTLHSITPTAEHVACMVDLLGRAGHLHEADNLIVNMPIASDDVVWMALLDACRIHGNIDMGRYAFECVMNFKPSCHQAYVVLSNIYALAGMWDEVLKIRNEMKNLVV